MQRYQCDDGETRAIWRAQDAIVFDVLINQLRQLVDDAIILNLIKQSITRTEIDKGYYYKIKYGIPLGSPLSPLLGAIMLKELDSVMSKHKINYVRFMDDWVPLCKTRAKLKQAIRLMYTVLNRLKLSVHPDKTSMGQIRNGFVFLGFYFKSNCKVSLADISLAKYFTKLKTLVNQAVVKSRMFSYIKHFCAWCNGVLKLVSTGVIKTIGFDLNTYSISWLDVR